MRGWSLVVCIAVVIAGVWSGQYLAVALVLIWFMVESRLQVTSVDSQLGGFATWLTLYGKTDALSVRMLDSHIRDLRLCPGTPKEQIGRLEQLRVLSELRSHLFGKDRGERLIGLKAAFIYCRTQKWLGEVTLESLGASDIVDAATHTAQLYWKLYDAASTDSSLKTHARQLYQEIFEIPFETMSARHAIEHLTDRMQHMGGVPYVVLNLLALGRKSSASSLMRGLVTSEAQTDDPTQSTLYWMAEVMAFDKTISLDFEGGIRNLYQLCLVAPEKAEMLEVDSLYFSQLLDLNEMAREGFLFKESFVDSVMELWAEFHCEGVNPVEGVKHFDDVFSKTLANVLGVSNKIYDNQSAWSRYWQSHRDRFCREYLWVVEGNLSYGARDFKVALECYDEALKLDSGLVVASLNRVLTLAQLKRKDEHELAVREIVDSASFQDPRGLYFCADSYLLLGMRSAADELFDRLRKLPGWEKKVDYYASEFCLDNELIEPAVSFAEAALYCDPESSLARFHLSKVYRASGDEVRALKVLGGIETPPHWMNFYRFTLERDAGLHQAASDTLKTLPRDYFQEQSDLDAAMEFARSHQDMALLRQLKRYQR